MNVTGNPKKGKKSLQDLINYKNSYCKIFQEGFPELLFGRQLLFVWVQG